VAVLVAAAGLGVVGAAARRWPPAAAAVSWLAVGLVATVGPWVPLGGKPPSSGMRVVEANVVVDRSRGEVVADILGQHPDLVVVTELGDDVDTPLRAAYASAARSDPLPGEYEGEVGLYSRWPVESGPLPGALAGQRGLRAVVEGPDGAFVVYALHLAKPTLDPHGLTEVGFGGHRSLVDELRRAAEAEALPTLVVGDLNLVDRTSGYRAMRRTFDDAMRARWVGPTSQRSWTVPLLARIDHVFMPRSWCSTDAGTFDLRDSDHRGVAVTLGRC
jgi:endonuclease/exonuclease/phosphatase (EEP) superfamily protein YafD